MITKQRKSKENQNYGQLKPLMLSLSQPEFQKETGRLLDQQTVGSMQRNCLSTDKTKSSGFWSTRGPTTASTTPFNLPLFGGKKETKQEALSLKETMSLTREFSVPIMEPPKGIMNFKLNKERKMHFSRRSPSSSPFGYENKELKYKIKRIDRMKAWEKPVMCVNSELNRIFENEGRKAVSPRVESLKNVIKNENSGLSFRRFSKILGKTTQGFGTHKERSGHRCKLQNEIDPISLSAQRFPQSLQSPPHRFQYSKPSPTKFRSIRLSPSKYCKVMCQLTTRLSHGERLREHERIRIKLANKNITNIIENQIVDVYNNSEMQKLKWSMLSQQLDKTKLRVSKHRYQTHEEILNKYKITKNERERLHKKCLMDKLKDISEAQKICRGRSKSNRDLNKELSKEKEELISKIYESRLFNINGYQRRDLFLSETPRENFETKANGENRSLEVNSTRDATKNLIEQNSVINTQFCEELNNMQNTKMGIAQLQKEVAERSSVKITCSGDLTKSYKEAIKAGNIELVKILLRTNPELLNQVFKFRQKSLHIAAKLGNLELIKYFCGLEEEKFKKESSTRTRKTTVPGLPTDLLKRTPYDIAIRNNHIHIVNYFKNYYAGETV